MSELSNLREVYARQNFVILDTETCGKANTSEVCQIGIIDFRGYTLLDCLVKPVDPIPEEASGIHGITNEMVRYAPSYANLVPVLSAILADRDVIIYNKGYDENILKHNAIRAGYVVEWRAKFHCAMLAYAEFYGQWNDYRNSYAWQTLSKAVMQQKLQVNNAHNALADCLMTLQIVEKMCQGEELPF